jgi:2-polyprenyl-3-methyl-5-hydroxy-6-metoxy-1,4-benzoquinol methylase
LSTAGVFIRILNKSSACADIYRLASSNHHDAQTTGDLRMDEAQARMFTLSAGYEAYMGRWSRLLVPAYVAFAGVKDGQRVLDVGTGTGALAATLQATMGSSEIVGIDPSAGFIDYAKKSAGSCPIRGGRRPGAAVCRCIVRPHDGPAGDEFHSRS